MSRTEHSAAIVAELTRRRGTSTRAELEEALGLSRSVVHRALAQLYADEAVFFGLGSRVRLRATALGPVERYLSRCPGASALDVAAHLNTPTIAAMRKIVAPLIATGRVVHDVQADTFALAQEGR